MAKKRQPDSHMWRERDGERARHAAVSDEREEVLALVGRDAVERQREQLGVIAVAHVAQLE